MRFEVFDDKSMCVLLPVIVVVRFVGQVALDD